MALLNKLFFPSAPTPTQTTATQQQQFQQQQQQQLHQSATVATTTTVAAGAATTPTKTAHVIKQQRATTNTTTTTTTHALNKSNTQTSFHTGNYLSQFPFDGRQVRILLYKEEDSRGRRLLFDSEALQKVYHNNEKCGSGKLQQQLRQQQQCSGNKTHSTNFIEVCAEYGYKHNRPCSSDITPIGEMVFGSSAMSFRGTALKVHWLPEPARILCSQVFLTPTSNSSVSAITGACASIGSQSPYSTLSMSSLLTTPRTSICSEHGSIDGLSLNSFTVSVGRTLSLTPSDRTSMLTSPLDVPSDQQSISMNSNDSNSTGPRYSSTYSNATDSGYSGMSRGQYSSDQWSYQYSTRSSLGSVLSDQSDPVRKLSMDSSFFPSSPYLEEFPSDGCLQRRISRNLRTSFEYENSMHDLIGFLSDNYTYGTGGNGGGVTGGSEGSSMVPNYRRASYCANESRSNPEIGKRCAAKAQTKRAKLGLAVCITMSESFEEEMELFCSEHIALLESMLSRLRASAERAYINHQNFLQIMFQGWQDVKIWFNDLFTAPRIKTPVWLSITTSGSKYSKNVAERFVKELCWLLSFADTKDTNFFVSTMLTAILTYHLGWVATVSAFNSTSSARTEASTAAIEQRAKLLQVSQKHPYNALWAQLGDLYGAIGIPPKLARTVIYGTEKLSIEKLLNVLTYFIRCGEVRRTAKREDFNKELISTLVSQSSNEKLKKNAMSPNRSLANMKKLHTNGGDTGSSIGGNVSGAGLSRTQTCKQNLSELSADITASELEQADTEGDEEDDSDGIEETEKNLKFIRTLKKNEIPTVLAFRDSRFVQQELRIGNYLMDTGIDKKTILLQQMRKQQANIGKDGRIRLTITTPDNEVMCMEDDSNVSTGTGTSGSIDDGAVEAIEIDAIDATNTNVLNKRAGTSNKKNFFWNMVPSTVKEGLSLSDLEKFQQGVKMCNRKLERRASSYSVDFDATDYEDGNELTPTQRRASHLSLSDLITQNSMGKSDRMTWGIEPIKENVSLEEQLHFEFSQKIIEREHGIFRQPTENNNGVVFVLGDNEPLVNIKKSNEDLTTDLQQSDDVDTKPPVLCARHQLTHDAILTKKHSGMKFNFEQYPQIATNYMKSKNLHYDLLMDKASKLEANEALKISDSCATLNQLQQDLPTTSSTTTTGSDACIKCSTMLRSYQTPINATELEFETDEVHCFQNAANTTNATTRPLHTVSSAASIDTLKSAPHAIEQSATPNVSELSEVQVNNTNNTSGNSSSGVGGTFTRNFAKRIPSQRSSISSVAAKCAAVNGAQHILKLPVPGIKELPQEDEPPGEKLRAGFIPSLFLSVNDHYVPDMVLQGTCASPNKWEVNLRQDLALAAHSASLISQPAENIAIVADMEKWDVRLLSSQAQHFPYAGGQSSPVGMSQLVSTMLETVQAMHAGGIAAYECLSYLESKLQEIYLQSETLAAFLLETDFCSLNAVTTALHLSENDVPLLLSIASIHTPKISRKCGISFR